MVNMIIFRLIKSDQNIMMLNLCASLILAYLIFISAVEETENEVVFSTHKIMDNKLHANTTIL